MENDKQENQTEKWAENEGRKAARETVDGHPLNLFKYTITDNVFPSNAITSIKKMHVAWHNGFYGECKSIKRNTMNRHMFPG